MKVGKPVVIKSELHGSEDLTIEDQVEGKIELKDHVLTFGPHSKIKAQVFAKALVVLDEVNGNIAASEKGDIRASASVIGCGIGRSPSHHRRLGTKAHPAAVVFTSIIRRQ